MKRTEYVYFDGPFLFDSDKPLTEEQMKSYARSIGAITGIALSAGAGYISMIASGLYAKSQNIENISEIMTTTSGLVFATGLIGTLFLSRKFEQMFSKIDSIDTIVDPKTHTNSLGPF